METLENYSEVLKYHNVEIKQDGDNFIFLLKNSEKFLNSLPIYEGILKFHIREVIRSNHTKGVEDTFTYEVYYVDSENESIFIEKEQMTIFDEYDVTTNLKRSKIF